VPPPPEREGPPDFCPPTDEEGESTDQPSATGESE
jgi:hypothetical protein